MAGKENILKRIKAAKPPLVPLPEIPDFPGNDEDLVELFCTSVKANHGIPILCEKKEISEIIEKQYPGMEISVSTLESVPSTMNIEPNSTNLTELRLSVLKGSIAVAENAAIWFPGSNAPHRAVPFVTEHLVLVVSERDIVANMHQAYRRIDNFEGYGCFIAGPSKTADIEQSLVIGAHGPRSLCVLITKD